MITIMPAVSYGFGGISASEDVCKLADVGCSPTAGESPATIYERKYSPMKNFIIAMICVAMILVLCACGGKGEAQETQAETTVETVEEVTEAATEEVVETEEADTEVETVVETEEITLVETEA